VSSGKGYVPPFKYKALANSTQYCLPCYIWSLALLVYQNKKVLELPIHTAYQPLQTHQSLEQTNQKSNALKNKYYKNTIGAFPKMQILMLTQDSAGTNKSI